MKRTQWIGTGWRCAALTGIAALLAGTPALSLSGQESPLTAEEMTQKARDLWSAPPERRERRCPEGTEPVDDAEAPEMIIVCRQLDDPARFMIGGPPSAGMDRTASGAPRAPDVSGLPVGETVVMRGCFLPPCPPPPALFIDLAAIPEAPPGSDAARHREHYAPTAPE